MHEITVTRQIDTGHRVHGHKGKCKNLHGHTYTITVTLQGNVDDHSPGFVVDFGVVKGIIDHWDHKMLLWEEDPVVVGKKVATYHPANDYFKEEDSVVRVPFNPTAENMAEYLANLFYDRWDNVYSVEVTVSETASTEATFGVGLAT